MAICPICKKSFAKKSKNVGRAENVHEMGENVNIYAENGRKMAGKNVEKSGDVECGDSEGCESGADARKEIVENEAEVVECGEEFWRDEKWAGRCPECETDFEGVFAFGWREGTLEKLVEEYKYQAVRAMGDELVELYDYILPDLARMGAERGVEMRGGKAQGVKDGEEREVRTRGYKAQDTKAGEGWEVIIVPLPTIGRHIRERGFDHTLTLAKKLARRRGWKCEALLTRELDTVQVGAKNTERKVQAAKAYRVCGEVDPEKVYLLLDDVWTTGTTMEAGKNVLKKAGAKKVFAAVMAVSRMKD